MGKERGKDTPGGYFRILFTERRDWLAAGTNGPVYEQWKKDHNGREMNASQKNIMANVKSVLRKKFGIGRTGRKKRGRPPGTAMTVAPRTWTQSMEHLEVNIDLCLSAARRLEPEKLEKVIDHLRRARNGVVMLLG